MTRRDGLGITFAVSLLVVATGLHHHAHAATSCPEHLLLDLREGVLLEGRVEQIAVGLKGVGFEACGAPLVQLARDELTSRTPTGVGDVATAWADPELLPLLYSAYAQGMFRPHERSDDLALSMADAIASISAVARPGEDLLVALREPEIREDWIDQSIHRFLVEWGPSIDSGELRPPPLEGALRAEVTPRMLSCLDAPDAVPPDTFDPLGLAVGPGARLSIGSRCATLAVVDTWRSAGSEDWQESFGHLLRQYTSMGDFLGLAATLEKAWNQGRSSWPGDDAPARTAWRTPDHGTAKPLLHSPGLLAALLFGVLAALLALAPSPAHMGRPRAWTLRCFAVLLGVAALIAADRVLGWTGVPPGDEGRPTARLALSVDPPPGRPGILLDQGGRAVVIPRPEGRVRIGIAGASSVAGVNLAHHDTFSANLERQLLGDLPCVEVLNFGQPGLALHDVRGTVVAATDAFGIDAMILYSGHNEVGAARERGPHRTLRGRLVALEAVLVRTHLMGLLRRSLPRPDPNAPEQSGAASQSEESMDLHLPEFEAAVNANYERELVDLVRAMRRRDVPLVLSMPSFNHHGLRLGTVPDMAQVPLERDGTTPANRIHALLAEGQAKEALERAELLRDQVPAHGAPYLLMSFAHEALGDLDAAEALIWEAARRNQVGSALTPGLAAVLLRVAKRFDLPLADVHAALHEASPGHLPGFDLFVDFVHLSPRGSTVVAAEMAASLRSSGLVDSWKSRCH
jgi:lysophospholipase L1-like esterase